MYEFGNFVNISSLSSYTNTYKKEGYFGRINYDYAHKYYASLSYRHDGSSRLQKRTVGGISGRSEQAGELVKRHL